MAKNRQLTLLAAAALLVLAACAKKKKSDDFQNFGGVAYNAAPKTLINSLGLNIAVQPIDINFDGKMDGLYVCRTGGMKQDISFLPAGSGVGFTNSPTVTIAGSGCSTTPKAHAVVANGRVERIVILNQGAGCTSNSFSVNIVGGSGTGAAAQVTGASGGTVTRISLINKGSGYNSPSVTITGAGGSGLTAGVNVGHDANGALTMSGIISGVYVLNPGDGRYNLTDAAITPLTVSYSGDSGTVTPYTVPIGNIVDSELKSDGSCSVTYDPTNVNPNLRHIPQMLFTWPVTPTVGLDTNGDSNADYFLYSNGDGSAQVMTNADGSGAAAKLIVKNPAVDETNDWIYRNLAYGQIIGFDVLNNSTIANNILGKIALDREDATFVAAANPTPIISPIRNGEFYGAPMDVNILCSDLVACNAITYSLGLGINPVTPDFGNVNLDQTGVDTSGTKHTIRPGDSSTISFQSLSPGTYTLKYIVRDAAGRESSLQSITFTVGRKPTITINPILNPYVSLPVGSTATVPWSAETLDNNKPFRYIILANSSCIEYSRADYMAAPTGNILLSSFPGPPIARNTPISSAIPAAGLFFTNVEHGVNYITICAITCENTTCNAATDLSVWGDKYTIITRDDTAPDINASPGSGIYARPLEVGLIGSVTTGAPVNGSLAPNEICYTWGADAAGNPTPGTTPADPVFPCPTQNNVVRTAGASTQFNVGFNQRAMVTDTVTYNALNCQGLGSDPAYCSSFTPGIYRIKYIARDPAGNVTTVQSQAYAVGVTPQITTNSPPSKHVWQYTAGWTVSSGSNPNTPTTWNWQVDFPGTYEIRVNDTVGDCTTGNIIVSSTAVAPLTPVLTSLAATNLPTMGTNTVKICFSPSGGGSIAQASQVIWRVQPQNFAEDNGLTLANTGSATVLRIPDGKCADVRYSAGNYIQWNFDGVQRQIQSCDGSPGGRDDLTLVAASALSSAPANVANIVVNTNYTKSYHNKNGIVTIDTAADIFNPPSAIRTIVFTCVTDGAAADTANASLGSDGAAACIQPTASGTALGGGRPGPDVFPQYTIDTNAVLNNKITTLAYNVTITMCDTSGACPAAGPTFNTSGTATNTSTVTVKLFIVKDKTYGTSIYVDPGGADTNTGLIKQIGIGNNNGPKRSISSAAAVAGGGKTIYVKAGNYCGNGAPACATTTGTLTLPSNTSVFGGYSANWYRPNASLNMANITAGSDASADSIGISVGAVNAPVWIEGLNLTTQRSTPTVVQGYNTIGVRATSGTNTLTLYRNTIVSQGDVTLAGGSNPGGSYGVYISGVNRLDMISNTVNSGRGWQGSNGPGGGATGGNAANASGGTAGFSGCLACCNDDTGHAGGGAGGNGGAGGANRGGNGGAGGYQNDGANGGFVGETAPNGGGGGGSAGPGATCGNFNTGGNGGIAPAPGNGTPGPAAGVNWGQIAGSTFLQAYSGGWGTDGGQGLGGGGGGGGGGAGNDGAGCLNDSGSGGGGGGGGGERGTGGEGGVAGGPSIALYLNSVNIINLSSNTFNRTQGGTGGNAKAGGGGGTATGGAGGGGTHDDGGNGGTGGNGRNGGSGGAGAGGNGGQSFGIVIFPNTTPTCSTANGHAGGGAATGGSSTGNAGVAGINRQCAIFNSTTPGALTACPVNCGSTGP